MQLSNISTSATSATQFPASYGGESGRWENESNVTTENGVCTNTPVDLPYSNAFFQTRHEFSIPSNAIITGIEAFVKTAGKTYNAFVDIEIRKRGSATLYTEAGTGAISLYASPCANVSWKTFGGETDLWGTTWVPADFNTGGNYNIKVKYWYTGIVANVNIDTTKMKVYYTIPETELVAEKVVCQVMRGGTGYIEVTVPDEALANLATITSNLKEPVSVFNDAGTMFLGGFEFLRATPVFNKITLRGVEYMRKALKCRANYNPIKFTGNLDGVMDEYIYDWDEYFNNGRLISTYENKHIAFTDANTLKAYFLPNSNSKIVDAAIDFIRNQSNNKQPFFVVVWFASPHNPHSAVEQDREPYSGQEEKLQHYYGEITGMDRAFGKLRQELKTLGIYKNTILWYCSDNGGQTKKYSHTGGRGHKGQIYEGGLRVPAILEWPARITKPRMTNLPCNTYDFYPTLLEIVGISMEKQPPLDGISLLPLINNELETRIKPLGFWQYPGDGQGVSSKKLMSELLKEQETGVTDINASLLNLHADDITNRYRGDIFPGHSAWLDWPYKLHRIQSKNDEVKIELYNLKEDAEEKNDLSAINSEKVKSMTIQIEAWLKSVICSLNGDDYN